MSTICKKLDGTNNELAAELFAVAAGKNKNDIEYIKSFLWNRLSDKEKMVAMIDIHQIEKIESISKRVKVLVMASGHEIKVSRRIYNDYVEARIDNDDTVWHDGHGGLIHGQRPAAKKLSPEVAQEWVDAAMERIEGGKRAHSRATGQYKRQM